MRMIRHYIIQLVWIGLLFTPVSLYAQRITAQRHTPLPSDTLLAYKLPFINVTDTGRNCIWDFSNIAIDSEDVVDINHFSLFDRDTLSIGIHREHANYYFHYNHDTLWLNGFERSHAHVQYSPAIPLLRFPFNFEDSLCGTFSGNGQYCHIIPLRLNGNYSVSADACGRLILPGMEIDSVLHVRLQMQYHSNTNILKSVREERHLLYSPYCRYPLLESVLVRTVNNTDSVIMATSYYYPQEQEDVPSRQQVSDSLLENVDTLITNVSYTPNPVYTNLHINFSLVKSAKVFISLHYNGGATTYQTPIRKEDEGEHSIYINMGGMPIGNYVVYIHADNTIVSGNIIKL